MKFIKKLKEDLEKKAAERKRKVEDNKRSSYIRTKWRKEKKAKKEKRVKHGPGYYLSKAGINIDTKKLSKIIFNICIGINLVITALVLVYFSKSYGYSLYYIFCYGCLMGVVL